MCGRFVVAQDREAYASFFAVDEVRAGNLTPSYNVAPTDRVYAVASHEGRRLLGTFRWGLIPRWATSAQGGHINARAETVADKAVFREAFSLRRCIIPADGFYEWRQLERGKLPYFICRRDGSPLALAGLWSRWHDPSSGASVASAAIITMDAHPSLAPIHRRMPVMLERGVWDSWLDPAESDPARIGAFLVPDHEGVLALHAVSTLVNDVRNNLPECNRPVPEPLAPHPAL